MYVGVIPVQGPGLIKYWRIPHVCGGDPAIVYLFAGITEYSPCMWG